MGQIAEAVRDDSPHQPHILLMEDESSVAQGLQMVLHEEGYTVDLAMTGQSALSTLSSKGFDLLVADLRLPDMDGMEVIKRVKDERPETEVIVITGYANTTSAVEAMKRGVKEYLPKPFTDEELKTAVKTALHQRKEMLIKERGVPGKEKLICGREVMKALQGTSEDPAWDRQKVEKPQQEYPDQANLLQQHKMISLGRLAASVVHEINNPLAGILNYLRLMKKIIRRGSLGQNYMEKFQKYLDLVESETSRCAKILGNLLDFSRKSKMEFTEVNIQELLDKSIMLSQHKLDLQNIQIYTEIEQALPAVWGDFNQVQQCLINLIFNAIDAMPQGGTLTIGCAHNGGKGVVEIGVKDTGSGISPQDLPHIFDPFYTTKTEGKGLGLGLSTVFGIIDLHKGTISVESQPGKGTVFTIKLPVDAGENRRVRQGV
ncbi:ATP-binding protein [Thermodesulfobacteriota bacterium]